MKLKIILFLILPALIISSCDTKKTSDTKDQSWDLKNTRIVESYDEINASAIKNAQDSLFLFIELFKSKQSKSTDFFIKSKFTDGEHIENIWSIVKSMKADTLFAILDNEPLKLTNIKLNDKIEVLKGNVEDWTIYNGDSLLYGNFIQRYQKPK